jgi:CHAT domain-containing protein
MVGWNLVNLARVYVDMDRFEEGQSCLERGLAITEKALGPYHPDVAETIEAYSLLCRLQNDRERALELSMRAFDIRFRNFSDNAYVLAERDALTYSQAMRASASSCLARYFDLGGAASEAAPQMANIVLLSKGSVSDGIFERRVALVEETDSTTLDLAEAFRNIKFELSQSFIAGPGDGDADEYLGYLDSLSTAATEIESALARRSASFSERQHARDVSLDRIQDVLPAFTVLVEYLKYDYYDPHSAEVRPRYLACIIRKEGEPTVIDLGEAQAIDELVGQYREHMLRVASTGRFPVRADKHNYESVAQGLYDTVVGPIEEALSGTKIVFIAPDAGLNLISFAGLAGRDGTYLAERVAIHYLSAGRDLVRLEYVGEAGTGLFALGDPDYDLSDAVHLAMTKPLEQPPLGPYAAGTRSTRSGCDDLRTAKVERLTHSRAEVESVAEAWARNTDQPVTVYLGKEASEENLKAEAPGNRVIHLATHGYFLESRCGSAAGKTGAAAVDFIGENPLLLSGVLLAGANTHGRTADSLGCEDGVLTAYEVSAMELDGTDTVVLSACESGLGEVQEGEGVYGLRRAFQMAGARVVLSALWPISDKATADMMAHLYTRSDETLPEAIQRIQLETMERLRAEGQTDHPYSWAAFVGLGDWR